MNEDEILKKVADLTIGRKIRDVVIPVRNRSVLTRLTDLFKRKAFKSKPYRIYPLYESVAGNALRIASIAVGLPDEITGNSLYEIAAPLIKKHHKDIVYVVATGITNNKSEPPESLIDLITWNLSYDELYEILHSILSGAGMTAFLNSTILIKGRENILRPRIDPIDGSGLIASHNAL